MKQHLLLQIGNHVINPQHISDIVLAENEVEVYLNEPAAQPTIGVFGKLAPRRPESRLRKLQFTGQEAGALRGWLREHASDLLRKPAPTIQPS